MTLSFSLVRTTLEKVPILRAYEVVMQHGSKEGELLQEDFPNSTIDEKNPVEIELETVVYDAAAPGGEMDSKKMTLTGKWSSKKNGLGLNPASLRKWDGKSQKRRMARKRGDAWGAPGDLLQPGRPEPHRILAFDSPEKQAEAVVKLLKEVLNERIKGIQSHKRG